MAAGRFITFEGGEGTGKSTQAGRLAGRLEALGIETVLTREPGGSPFAEQLRDLLLSPHTAKHDPISETLLFYAARADHLAKTIRPALASGRWVICDRFSDSTRVYQGAAGGLADETIVALEALVVAPTRPALTIILDLQVAKGLARAKARREESADSAADSFESRDITFHSRIRDGFLEIAHAEPDRCVVINAARPIDDIAGKIWSKVEARLLKSKA